MKVLLSVHHFPPKYTGGAELRALRTARALASRGHNIRILTVEDTREESAQGLSWVDSIQEGIPVRRLSINQESIPNPVVWEYLNPWIGENVGQLIDEWIPDLFHLIGGYLITGSTLLAASERHVATIVTLTDFWFLCPRITMLQSNGALSTLPIDPVSCVRCLAEEKKRYRYLGQLFPSLSDKFWKSQSRLLERIEDRLAFNLFVLETVDRIISPSEFLRGMYIKAGISPEKIEFSRQGRDFPGLTVDRVAKTASTELRIGYLGQIAPHKGLHTLIESLRNIDDLSLNLKIYGDLSKFPSYVDHLEQLAKEDKRIMFQGVYNTEEQLTEILRNIDIVVVPSLWYENSPNTILEAFAHSTPVIAADIGGMSELVEEGINGLLFRVGDSEHLAEKIQVLLDNPQLKVNLQGGIKPVKDVSEEMDDLEAIYRSILTVNSRKDMRVPIDE